MVLVGDIGGTKTTLALAASDDPSDVAEERTFASGRYRSLEDIIQEYFHGGTVSARRAVFGIAGPVYEGVAKTTNLPWTVAESVIEELFGFSSVTVINDLAAIARAVPLLRQNDVRVLYEGPTAVEGNIAVIAPGTGLGEAFLTFDGTEYYNHASEGGHSDFAPRTSRQDNLLRYLRREFEHVSYERVCSGPGISRIYEFLRDEEKITEPSRLAKKIASVKDATPVIVEAALSEPEAFQLCDETLRLFSQILAAEAGNLALKVSAFGGIYIGGGIPRRIMPYLADASFTEAIQRKGRMRHLLEQMAVKVIVNEKVNLIGAACYGIDR